MKRYIGHMLDRDRLPDTFDGPAMPFHQAIMTVAADDFTSSYQRYLSREEQRGYPDVPLISDDDEP